MNLSATLNFDPSFSSSAITQSVIQGTPGRKQDVNLKYGNGKVRMELLTLSIEAVHHALSDVQLVLDGKIDEVGINQDVIWRTQLCVVLEE